MGMKRLTIIRQVHNKNLGSYDSRYNLYVAQEAPIGLGQPKDVYLLTTEIYPRNFVVNLDTSIDIEPMTDNPSGRMDGLPIYVKRAPVFTPTGHFNVKAMIPATDPFERFRLLVLDRSRYNLYEVTHVPDNGKETSVLSRVFSEVMFFHHEDIRAGETTQIFPMIALDDYRYFVHDKKMFDQRAAALFFPGSKKHRAP